jgi:hypothetical protein
MCLAIFNRFGVTPLRRHPCNCLQVQKPPAAVQKERAAEAASANAARVAKQQDANEAKAKVCGQGAG